MKEKFKTPQTAIRWLFAGFTLLCLLAAVISAALYHESASDIFAGLGRICTQSGQTVKSYFDSSYGGFGGTFLNVALVCAVCLGLSAPVRPSSVSEYFHALSLPPQKGQKSSACRNLWNCQCRLPHKSD